MPPRKKSKLEQALLKSPRFTKKSRSSQDEVKQLADFFNTFERALKRDAAHKAVYSKSLFKNEKAKALAKKKYSAIQSRIDHDEDKVADTRFKVKSDAFDIDSNDKAFYIGLSKLKTECGLSDSGNGNAGPWPTLATTHKGEKDLGQNYPKISMISEETGKDATFFLSESSAEYLIFKPSKGTVMKKHTQLRGWSIMVDRDG